MTTGIHPDDLRRLITDVLRGLDLFSPAALALLIGTAATESACGRRLYQLAGGPARGIYQMEPRDMHDIWANYLPYCPSLRDRIITMTGHNGPGPWLAWDLAYQTAMARVHYLRIPDPLPPPDDIIAQACYWKTHYNTHDGRGHVTDYIHAARTILNA